MSNHDTPIIRLELSAMASEVGEGQHTGLRCPVCKSPDNALSMLVYEGYVKAICHRNSCGFRYNSIPYAVTDMPRASRSRPYTGDLQGLEATDYDWLAQRFNMAPGAFATFRKSETRYFLPIFGPERNRRGWISRRAWEGSPAYYMSDQRPKSLTYMDNEEPVQSWTGHTERSPLVVVEDQISALRVTWDTGLPAVAILGTGVNEEKIAELQRHAKHIVFALDSDATGQAFSHARKWGQAFETCRVLILRRDLKDEPAGNLENIFSQIAPT